MSKNAGIAYDAVEALQDVLSEINNEYAKDVDKVKRSQAGLDVLSEARRTEGLRGRLAGLECAREIIAARLLALQGGKGTLTPPKPQGFTPTRPYGVM